MDWSTIAIEVLERILCVVDSVYTIGSCSSVCRQWNIACEDQHLWKHLYAKIFASQQLPSCDNWKRSTLETWQIQNNIKAHKCVVRTICSSYQLAKRVEMDIDCFSLYKDHLLAGWQTLEDCGSYGHAIRQDSQLFNLVTEEVENAPHPFVFINGFVVQTKTGMYGGPIYANMSSEKFDPTKKLLAKPSTPIQLKGEYTFYYKNYCIDSIYSAFVPNERNLILHVMNLETGKEVYSMPLQGQELVAMYDQNLAVVEHVGHLQKEIVKVIDIHSIETRSRTFDAQFKSLFMFKDHVVLQFRQNITIWDYLTDKVIEYVLSGEARSGVIKLVYKNMLVRYCAGLLSFYRIEDGTLVGSVGFAKSSAAELSELSDGRIAVANRYGCQVISFMNSDVNNRFNVLILDQTGTKKEVNIAAHELVSTYINHIHNNASQMTSRFFYRTDHERYSMIFAQLEKNSAMVNAVASKWVTVKADRRFATAFNGWLTESTVNGVQDEAEGVVGHAMLVHEKKIGDRWQMCTPQDWPLDNK